VDSLGAAMSDDRRGLELCVEGGRDTLGVEVPDKLASDAKIDVARVLSPFLSFLTSACRTPPLR